MIPVFQTRFGRPVGNCWAASIASILELPLEAVDWSPDMTAEEIEPAGGTDVSDEWLRRRDRRIEALGFFMSRLTYDATLTYPAGVHALVLGQNANGVGHVCVWRDGAIVHDPNPGGAGLATIEEITFLVRR